MGSGGGEGQAEEQGREPASPSVGTDSGDNSDVHNVVLYRKVSWYDYKHDGINCDDPNCITANGETYNPEAFTTACWKEYPFKTRFRVCRLDNSKCVIVECNDRGAFKRLGRFLDISKRAFQTLWPLTKGVSEAKIKVL